MTMFGIKKKTAEEPLTVTYIENDDGITVMLKGRIDSITSPSFQAEAAPKCKGIPATLDMAGVTYISSAGLRVILALDKATGKNNKLSIINAEGAVKDVLDMSGFSDFI